MTQSLIVQLNKSIALSATDVEEIVNGITNQDSGLMALKSVCQKENLLTNKVFEWCRNKGWLEEYPSVTAKAILDWATVDPFTGVVTVCEDNILLMIVNNSHYVNTSSSLYPKFINALTNANLTAGYNRVVKRARIEITEHQIAKLKLMGHKVVKA